MICKAMIFDLDGVITETSNQHFSAWKKIASELGITLPETFEEQLKGVSRRVSIERILAFGGIHLTEEKIKFYMNKKNELYLTLIESITSQNLLPGVKNLLEHLKNSNIKIALASASINGPKLLKQLQIEDYFDFVANPVLYKSKPAPDLFLAGMKQFGFKPEECIGVEDAVAGIDAIKSAGMIAIGIGIKTTLVRADYIYNSPLEIPLNSIRLLK